MKTVTAMKESNPFFVWTKWLAIAFAGLVGFSCYNIPEIYTNDPDTGMCTLLTQYKVDPLKGLLISGPYGVYNSNAPCPNASILVVADK